MSTADIFYTLLYIFGIFIVSGLILVTTGAIVLFLRAFVRELRKHKEPQE